MRMGAMFCGVTVAALVSLTASAAEMVVVEFQPELADTDYNYSKGEVVYEEGKVTFTGPQWWSGFGIYAGFENDFSDEASQHLALTLKKLPDNKLRRLEVQMVSNDGTEHKSSWFFNVKSVKGDDSVTLVAETPLSEPGATVENGADLSEIRMINFIGVEQASPHAIALILEKLSLVAPEPGE